MAAPCQTAGLTRQAPALFSGAVNERIQPGLNWQPGTGAWGAAAVTPGGATGSVRMLISPHILALRDTPGPQGARRVRPGPSAEEAGCRAWGRDLESAFSPGGPLAPGPSMCVGDWKGSHGA